jgi:pimeloyl-ACP methyl ester carboxylesterase
VLYTQNLTLDSVPLLLTHPRQNPADNRGVVFFSHGLFGQKENGREILEILTDLGYLAIGMDNRGHGQRRWKELEARINPQEPESEGIFLELVLSSAQDIPGLRLAIQEKGWNPQGFWGIAGVSMGGYITHTVLTLDQAFDRAVSIVGSPRYKLDWPQSPHLHLGRFDQVRLLNLTAGKDDIVHSKPVWDFHRKLSQRYSDAGHRFFHHEYPDSGHMMREEDWADALRRLREWFSSN